MNAQLENLVTAHNALCWAIGSEREARMQSRLLDAAISAGMPRDHVDLDGWVSKEITSYFLSDPSDDVFDEEVISPDEFGNWEYTS